MLPAKERRIVPDLTSSASGSGKKVVPKGPARRRPAPAAAPPPSASTTPSVALSAAPPSPPPTQLHPLADLPSSDVAGPPPLSAAPTQTPQTPVGDSISVASSQIVEVGSGSRDEQRDTGDDRLQRDCLQVQLSSAQSLPNGGVEDVSHAESERASAVDEVPSRAPTVSVGIVEPDPQGDVNSQESGKRAPAGEQQGLHEVVSASKERRSRTRRQTAQEDAKASVDEGTDMQVASSGPVESQPELPGTVTTLPSDGESPTPAIAEQTAESRLAEYYVQDGPIAEESVMLETPKARASTRRSTTKRVRIDTSAADASRPAKRTKRTSTRSNAKLQSVAEAAEANVRSLPESTTDTEVATDSQEATQPRKRKRVVRQATESRRKGKGKAAAKSAATVESSDDEGELARASATPAEAESNDPEARPAQKRPVRKQRRKKPRKETIEGEEDQDESDDEEQEELEQHQIDPDSISMWSLSHDSKHGKTSEREKAMAKLPWAQLAQQRREAAELIASGQQDPQSEAVIQSVEGADGTATERQNDAQSDEHETTETGIGAEDGEGEDQIGRKHGSDDSNDKDGSNTPKAGDPEEPNQADEENDMTLELDANGQIVVREEDLVTDRGAVVDTAVNTGKPIEDDNDLTTQINRTTWMNSNRRDPLDRVPAWKWKSDPWPEEETDRFYEALRMFGTDFFIISKMFHPKTRRMIKAKFNREERLDPQRINDALMGKSTKPMNLEHYSQQTGRDVSVYQQYEGYDHVQQVIQAAMKEREDAMTTTIQQEAAAAEERAEREKQEKKEKKSRRGKVKKAKVQNEGTMGGGLLDD